MSDKVMSEACITCSTTQAFEPSECQLYHDGKCPLQGRVLVAGKVIDVKRGFWERETAETEAA